MCIYRQEEYGAYGVDSVFPGHQKLRITQQLTAVQEQALFQFFGCDGDARVRVCVCVIVCVCVCEVVSLFGQVSVSCPQSSIRSFSSQAAAMCPYQHVVESHIISGTSLVDHSDSHHNHLLITWSSLRLPSRSSSKQSRGQPAFLTRKMTRTQTSKLANGCSLF